MFAERYHQSSYTWGNATYVDCFVNESIEFSGKKITLVSLENNFCTVRVGSVDERLVVARRSLPVVIEGIRIFIADNKNVKNISTDSEYHGLMKHDAFICLSDASQPLLDPERYIFPISRQDGYHWHMEESSHMFSYYGYSSYMKKAYNLSEGEKYFRSHEGIDFNLHDARGIEKHPLVAIEAGTVRMVHQANKDEMCVIIESESDPGIYYIYKHIYVKHYYVKEGQHVKKGDMLAYIWGDNVWGHLHFAVVKQGSLPEYNKRYTNLLNCFPHMYELWHGDLTSRPRVWKEGQFSFAHDKWQVENKLRMAVYDEIVGYGWRIEDWCTAGALELYPDKSGCLPLQKIMHKGALAECENPHNFYDFEVAVEKGSYIVSAKVGEMEESSWQKVTFNGVEAGTFELVAGEFQGTETKTVKVLDGRLIVRIELKDKNTRAGINELHFQKISDS